MSQLSHISEAGLAERYANPAEILLFYESALRGREIKDASGFSDVAIPRIALGKALKARLGLCLRALVEDWPADRIVRELY